MFSEQFDAKCDLKSFELIVGWHTRVSPDLFSRPIYMQKQGSEREEDRCNPGAQDGILMERGELERVVVQVDFRDGKATETMNPASPTIVIPLIPRESDGCAPVELTHTETPGFFKPFSPHLPKL